MPSTNPTPWFVDSGQPFAGTQPWFYDTGDFPWVCALQSQWTQVRDELLANLDGGSAIMSPYIDGSMASRLNRWKTLGLMFWTLRSDDNIRKFPRTWQILRDVPGLIAASLNVLEAETTIKPHIGNTDAIIRCHLGLVVPEPAPRCGFRVGGETRSWQEGRLLMFCDAHEHTAWNNSNRPRYILVLDVVRPEFQDRLHAVSARVLAGIRLDAAAKQKPWVRRLVGVPALQRMAFATLQTAYRAAMLRRSLRDLLRPRRVAPAPQSRSEHA